MKLKDVVKDWGGFEKFVEEIHKQGTIETQHDVTLTGRSGASRQIDVLLTHTVLTHKYTTLIECKFWNSKVERSNIDVLYASMLDLNASKGVFFTTVGYQAGAETYASSMGISIYTIRELTDEEWGLPGRVIELYLQTLQPSLLALNAEVAALVGPEGDSDSPPPTLSVKLGLEKADSNNIVVSSHKNKHRTLEDLIEHYIKESIPKFGLGRFLINGGEDCTRYLQTNINMDFAEKLLILSNNSLLQIEKIEMRIGIKIIQSKITIDRSQNYIYAFAVHDCITSQTHSAFKRKDCDFAEWTPHLERQHGDDEIVKNGSIILIVANGYFDPSEISSLKPVDVKLP